MGGSVVAGLTDIAAILHEKLTIDNLSNTLLQNKKIFEETVEKLSEIKDVSFDWAKVVGEKVTRNEGMISKTSICEYGSISVDPVKFAVNYLNGDFSSVWKQFPEDVSYGSVALFKDSHSVGGYGVMAIIKEIGGYDIQSKLVENEKNIQVHQIHLNIALGLLIPVGISLGVSLGLMYLSNPQGTKQMLMDAYIKAERKIGRFYDKNIRTPLAMRKMQGYQNWLYGPTL